VGLIAGEIDGAVVGEIAEVAEKSEQQQHRQNDAAP
jgi:hypothetical protein